MSPPYVGADLDGCRRNGICEPWAEQIIGELDSYTELSPAQTGVRIIVKGELPDGARQKDFGGEHHGVGFYDAARLLYLTMTGAVIRARGIAERSAELRQIHVRLFPPKPKTQTKAKSVPDTPLGDEDLIARAAHGP